MVAHPHTLSFAHKGHDAPESAPGLAQSPVSFVLEHRERLITRVLALAGREFAACRASHNTLASALTLDAAARGQVPVKVAFVGVTRPHRSACLSA